MVTTQTNSLPLPLVLTMPLVAVVHMLSRFLHRARWTLKTFGSDNRGQDLVEYALIVAFAVGVVAVLTALYSTIKSVLTKANTSLQAASK